MQTKITKNQPKQANKFKSVRLNLETQKKAERLLNLANRKKLGRKIKFDQLFDLALDLMTDDHIKSLQTKSLTNANRTEILRQKYIPKSAEIPRQITFSKK